MKIVIVSFVLLFSSAIAAGSFVHCVSFNLKLLFIGPISLDMACKKALSTVACTFEFTNNGNEDYYLLKYNTPLEGPFSPFVTVSLEGRPLQYKGILATRIPPTKESFVLLKAGQSISATIQITDIFSFTRDGLYTIRYDKPLQYVSGYEMNAKSVNDTIRVCSQSHDSSTTHIYLENTGALLQPKGPEDYDISTAKTKYTVKIESCCVSDITFENFGTMGDSKIIEIHKKLCPNILKAKNKVGDNELYKEWFERTYTTTRSDKVRDMYQKIYNWMGKNTAKYSQGADNYCKTVPLAAYSLKGSSTVWLCPGVFNYPTHCFNDESSIEEIIVHQWSIAIGGTMQYALLPCPNMELAKTDPDKAILNAENYAQFYCLAHTAVNTNTLLVANSIDRVSNAQRNVTMESCNNAKFEGFSSSDEAIILEAHKKICNNLQKVINSVGDTGTYRKWFEKKTFTKARSDKVKDTYQKIYDAMINGDLLYKHPQRDYYCTANNKIFVVYVPSTSGYAMYICPLLLKCPKSCLPPGSDDGNTIEGMILYGWAEALIPYCITDDRRDVKSCEPIRYAKYYPDKAIKSCSNYAFYYCETR